MDIVNKIKKLLSAKDYSPQQLAELLTKATARDINGCRRPAYDGTDIFLPDAGGHYGAQWTRDFAYMVEFAGEFFTPGQIKNGFIFLAKGARADGWIPDRVRADGVPVYIAGAEEHPLARENLDNASFFAYLLFAAHEAIGGEEKRDFYFRWKDVAERGLAVLPVEKGLIYNDSRHPHSGYGFTDSICRTGYLMIESLLYWRALTCLKKLRETYALPSQDLQERIAALESRFLESFLDNDILLAATEDCRQADHWGSAMALSFGFPMPAAVKDRIAMRLITDCGKVIYKGQMRHSDKPWQKTFMPERKGTYQNGAYWQTATVWYVMAVYPYDKNLAMRVFLDAARYAVNVGTYECVNRFYKKLDGYVASATNVYGSMTFLKAKGEL